MAHELTLEERAAIAALPCNFVDRLLKGDRLEFNDDGTPKRWVKAVKPPDAAPASDAGRAFMEWWHRAGIGTRENPKKAWHAAVAWAASRKPPDAAPALDDEASDLSMEIKLAEHDTAPAGVDEGTLRELAEEYVAAGDLVQDQEDEPVVILARGVVALLARADAAERTIQAWKGMALSEVLDAAYPGAAVVSAKRMAEYEAAERDVAALVPAAQKYVSITGPSCSGGCDDTCTYHAARDVLDRLDMG